MACKLTQIDPKLGSNSIKHYKKNDPYLPDPKFAYNFIKHYQMIIWTSNLLWVWVYGQENHWSCQVLIFFIFRTFMLH